MFFELLLIAFGLGMDSFSVSICKGLAMKQIEIKKVIKIALVFGLFQGIMPTIGFFLGKTFSSLIINIDHWIAFILLGVIGINMIKEAFSDEEENVDDKVDLKTLCVLGLATSIDALIIGITFSLMNVNIFLAASIITGITFIMCIIGVKLGNILGCKFGKKAEILGGVILILMGTKILLEHLSIL